MRIGSVILSVAVVFGLTACQTVTISFSGDYTKTRIADVDLSDRKNGVEYPDAACIDGAGDIRTDNLRSRFDTSGKSFKPDSPTGWQFVGQPTRFTLPTNNPPFVDWNGSTVNCAKVQSSNAEPDPTDLRALSVSVTINQDCHETQQCNQMTWHKVPFFYRGRIERIARAPLLEDKKRETYATFPYESEVEFRYRHGLPADSYAVAPHAGSEPSSDRLPKVAVRIEIDDDNTGKITVLTDSNRCQDRFIANFKTHNTVVGVRRLRDGETCAGLEEKQLKAAVTGS